MSKSDEQIIRLSLGWILVGFSAILAVGVIGGVIGQQFVSPPLPPLTNNRDSLITNLQEVTISPNTAATQLIQQNHRSVLLLTSASGTAIGTAVTLTNDGVIATTAPAPPSTGGYTARDHEGRVINLSLIGRDPLFGLTYFRAADNVLVPIDIRQTDAAPAETLFGVSRNPDTFQPRVSLFTVAQHLLPDPATPAGVQRLLQGIDNSAQPTTPLIDEEGRLAAITTSENEALPASQLRTSFERLTANQREADPLTDRGLQISYIFFTPTNQPATFAAHIDQVTTGSPAQLAGLRRGDVITGLDEEALAWDDNLAQQLSDQEPHTITFIRTDRESTVTLTAPTAGQ